jgi:hypothetical protein
MGQGQSQEALKAAADLQKEASAQQEKANKAQAKVDKLQHELAQAQSDASREAQLAQEKQNAALAANQTQAPVAQAGQQQALQGQQQQEQMAAAPVQVSGTVKEAAGDRINISTLGGPLTLRITDSTTVTLNGSPSTIGEIPPGTAVRASYQAGEGLPMAVRLDAGAMAPP